MTTGTQALSALEKVQNLYILQVELWNFLDRRKVNKEECKKAKKNLREFKTLLKQVDFGYVGGEDVIETLQRIQDEVSAKLRSAQQ